MSHLSQYASCWWFDTFLSHWGGVTNMHHLSLPSSLSVSFVTKWTFKSCKPLPFHYLPVSGHLTAVLWQWCAHDLIHPIIPTKTTHASNSQVSYRLASEDLGKIRCYNNTSIIWNGLAQDCSNSSALAMELLQSCSKPSMYSFLPHFHHLPVLSHLPPLLW